MVGTPSLQTHNSPPSITPRTFLSLPPQWDLSHHVSGQTSDYDKEGESDKRGLIESGHFQLTHYSSKGRIG